MLLFIEKMLLRKIILYIKLTPGINLQSSNCLKMQIKIVRGIQLQVSVIII